MELFFKEGDGETGRVFSVAEIVRAVNEDLEEGFGEVWVQGEVGEVTVARSGHVYFSLKDETQEAVLSAVMFKQLYARRKFDLAAGRRIVARGSLSIYAPRGSFQMVAKGFSDAGAGLLALQFEALKRKLMEEGLTDEARKRPLPAVPRAIGIVTSLEAAALQDMLRVLGARFPARIVISPAMVQGEEAPAQLAGALERIAAVEGLEVVIIGRGGGSAEDLAAFNDERLARAIAACPVPVISAVGHEVDVTISDLVADLRAPTPTAAAQLVIPTKEDLETRLHGLEVRMSRSVEGTVAKSRTRLLLARQRVASPERLIMERRQRVDELMAGMTAGLRRKTAEAALGLGRLGAALSHLHPGRRIGQRRDVLRSRAALLEQLVRRRLERAGESLSVASSRLDALSPLGVLARGYAIATRGRDRAVIKSPEDVEDGEGLDVRVRDGVLPCVAKKT
jgi:exodeoxyribonuclease VII large subunit